MSLISIKLIMQQKQFLVRKKRFEKISLQKKKKTHIII